MRISLLLMGNECEPCAPDTIDMSLHVRFLSEQQFGDFRKEWNTLLDQSHADSFFLKWEWCHNFWETRQRRHKSTLLACCCYDGDALVGIGPFYGCRTGFSSRREVRFLGDRIASDFLDIFSLPDYEERVCSAIAKEFVAMPHDMMFFSGVAASSSICRSFVDSIKNAHTKPFTVAPRATLPRSFEDYFGSLSRATRYMIRRKQRAVQRDYAVSFEARPIARNHDMLDLLFLLHHKRWNQKAGASSTFHSHYRKHFNTTLIDRLEPEDGFFFIMNANTEPVSILYCFVYKHSVFFYQNGWEPAFERYSVGLLTIKEAVEYSIERGMRKFEFLRGPERYKKHFAREERHLSQLVSYADTLRGRSAQATELIRTHLRKTKNSIVKLKN
ncbi:MAG: GNAT family N-acetyltransferase [Chitinivibrionales bacterium]|nr:GNAT family N-acetyltransferase [Chitinivibrionales bacterium]MBD3355839.1 GNAT family N-acetyltransferase [Chitinivibrionales bacterium]